MMFLYDLLTKLLQELTRIPGTRLLYHYGLLITRLVSLRLLPVADVVGTIRDKFRFPVIMILATLIIFALNIYVDPLAARFLIKWG